MDRLVNHKRVPQQINLALHKAMPGQPGPVYIDSPGHMRYQNNQENPVAGGQAVRARAGAPARAGGGGRGRFGGVLRAVMRGGWEGRCV